MHIEGRTSEYRGRATDDDLTPLTWLQDENLLKGIQLPTPAAPTDADTIPQSELEELDIPVKEEESTCAAPKYASPANLKHPSNIPYDPQIHIKSKPPFSFSCLIFMAIEDSPLKAIPVKEVYDWIEDKFPYYKTIKPGWKNSVRHNLSMGKSFLKLEKSPNDGKGCLWIVDPMLRPTLIAAREKAPYNFHRLGKSAGDGIRSNSLQSDDYDSGLPHEDSNADISDVDAAAAAILALKHGPNISLDSKIWLSSSSRTKKSSTKKAGLKASKSSATQELSLASLAPIKLQDEMAVKQEECDNEAISVNDAYCADDESSKSRSSRGSVNDEEQRKIEEGADALLNLAGISTSPSWVGNKSDPGDMKVRKDEKDTPRCSISDYKFKPRFIRGVSSLPKKRKTVEDNVKQQKKPKKPKPEKSKPKKIKQSKNVANVRR